MYIVELVFKFVEAEFLLENTPTCVRGFDQCVETCHSQLFFGLFVSQFTFLEECFLCVDALLQYVI